MLNPALDLAALRDAFAATGRIRIRNVLAANIADALARDMAQLRYSLFCATAKGVAVIDPADLAAWDPARKAELNRFLMKGASEAEGFAYNGFRMTEAWGASPTPDSPPDTPLSRFNAFLTSAPLLAAIRTVTGASTFDSVFAQATQYLPGHYLTRHLDDPKGETRKFAFVWGLTRVWQPDWGGLLQFFTPDGEPTDSLSPGYNTLDLFDVRHWHSVTYVAPFALAPRLAVSGWFTKQ